MFRHVVLPPDIDGALYLHSMPGRYEPLSASLAEIADKNVAAIICLTPLEEIEEKSPEYAAAIAAGTIPVERVAMPIEDYGVPQDTAAFVALMEDVAHRLQAGENLLVHCAGGIGRTGTFATGVLMALHVTLNDALDAVQMAGSEPETDKQQELLVDIADRLN